MSISTFVQALKTCESANGAGKKAVIVGALKGLSKEGRVLMYYAMNPYYTYGVKKFDRPKEYSPEDGELSTITDVLDQLRNRELTGTAARDTVTMLLSAFTQETANYLERVIEKDLKAGFSPDTYNKVWTDDKVPVFNVMLADKCEDADEFEKYVTFPCQADWKYDGTRTISMVTRKFKITNEDGSVILLDGKDIAELSDGTKIQISNLKDGADVSKYHRISSGDDDGVVVEEGTGRG
jgi:DNA ligase-1